MCIHPKVIQVDENSCAYFPCYRHRFIIGRMQQIKLRNKKPRSIDRGLKDIAVDLFLNDQAFYSLITAGSDLYKVNTIVQVADIKAFIG